MEVFICNKCKQRMDLQQAQKNQITIKGQTLSRDVDLRIHFCNGCFKDMLILWDIEIPDRLNSVQTQEVRTSN